MKQYRTRSFLENPSIGAIAPILLGLKADTSRMIKALKTPDDIGAMIRIHKDLDRALKHIVSVMLPRSGRPKLRSMSQRITHLKIAGLSDHRLAASETINAIRNAFAHHDKENFEATDVDRLLAAIRLVLGGIARREHSGGHSAPPTRP